MIFLVYKARSGSTLLSSMLNTIDKVGVTIEDSIPGGLGLIDKNYNNKNEIYDILLNDKKFKEWKISKSKIKKIVYNGQDVLQEMLSAYFNTKKVEQYIYKCPGYIHYPKVLLDKYPNSKFIHIYRDPRAVYSSQNNNKISSDDKYFSTNPFTFSLVWKRAIKQSFIFNNNNRFINIKYEDLVEKPEKTLKAITKFIGVEYKILKSNDYYSNIPKNQRYLHKNIKDKPLSSRINAWEEKISINESNMIQILLKREMKILGYNEKSYNSNFMFIFFFLKYFVSHFLTYFSNIILSLLSPKSFLLKFKYR